MSKLAGKRVQRIARTGKGRKALPVNVAELDPDPFTVAVLIYYGVATAWNSYQIARAAAEWQTQLPPEVSRRVSRILARTTVSLERLRDSTDRLALFLRKHDIDEGSAFRLGEVPAGVPTRSLLAYKLLTGDLLRTATQVSRDYVELAGILPYSPRRTQGPAREDSLRLELNGLIRAETFQDFFAGVDRVEAQLNEVIRALGDQYSPARRRRG